MYRLLSVISLSTLFLSSSACSKEPTEIIVTIDTTLGVPCAINRVLVEVTTGSGMTQSESIVVSDADLPGSLTLVAGGNPGQLTVKVTGLLDEMVIATAEQLVEFADETSREVRFLLDEDCTGSVCGAKSVGDFSGLPAKAPRVECGQERYKVSGSSLALINNACAGGTLAHLFVNGDDEMELESPLEPKMPFPFFYYGKPVSTFFVGDNGYMSFTESAPGAVTSSVGDPRSLGQAGGFPAAGVLPFWDKLVAGPNGVCFRVDGDAPQRTLIVTWDRACFGPIATCGDSTGGTLSFSIGLEERTNKIFFAYHSMIASGANADRAKGQSAVIGISGGGPPACNADECTSEGLCANGDACGYSEFSALTTVISGTPLPKLEFEPQGP